MKKFIFPWLALLLYSGATAQLVTIPDAYLTGIKSFTNLANLCVENNSLTSLDVSGLAKLTSLSCAQNF